MKIVRSQNHLTAEAAHAAAAAAVAEGARLGQSVVAAVADASGDLIALLRADGAFKASIGIARDKAYTAAVFGASTDALSQGLESNPVLHHGIAMQPGVILFGGGVPVVAEGAVIGGVGVSGGSEDDDRRCAGAGLAALGLA